MNQTQRITSSKQFDGMIKVTGKWVWVILSILVLLVAGMVTFAFTQTIERKLTRSGAVMTIPMEELFDITPGEFENVFDATELEEYMMLDNLNPFMSPDLIKVFVTAEDLNRNMFNLGTKVRVGSVDGVITYMNTNSISTYDELRQSTGMTDEELSRMEVYPGQQYFYVLIGPEVETETVPAEATEKTAEPAETEMTEEEILELLESIRNANGEGDDWLKDVEGVTTENGIKCVPCEIIVQSVKLSSFILK